MEGVKYIGPFRYTLSPDEEVEADLINRIKSLNTYERKAENAWRKSKRDAYRVIAEDTRRKLLEDVLELLKEHLSGDVKFLSLDTRKVNHKYEYYLSVTIKKNKGVRNEY